MPPQCTLGIPTVWQTRKLFVLFNSHNAISRGLMQDLMHTLWLTPEYQLDGVQAGCRSSMSLTEIPEGLKLQTYA